MSRNLVAMSGGVDSAAAMLLTKDGLGGESVGLTLALAREDSPEHLVDLSNIADAAAVCRLLGAEHRQLYAYPRFSERVIAYFAKEYEAGRTPNPCVMCNREIKFGLLAEYADANGFDKIVTGHYARLTEFGGYTWIARAADLTKDQSYVLAMLSQEQLRRAYFPRGGMTKAQVRELAAEHGFVSAHRKDSQDICFIPDGDYVRFLTDLTGKAPEPGDYLDPDGNVIGRHKGHLCYTIGQRKGLGIALGRHVFVLSKDASANTVTLGDEPELLKRTVTISGLNCPSDPAALDGDVRCQAKLRYAHKPAEAVFHRTGTDAGILEFTEPQRAPSPGQFAVMYADDCVIGAGVIE